MSDEWLAYLERLSEVFERVAASFEGLAAAIRDSEVREIQSHPDLAYLDAQLDGFYGSVPPKEQQ